MTCKEYQAWLDNDDESPSQIRAAQAHHGACESCRKIANEYLVWAAREHPESFAKGLAGALEWLRDEIVKQRTESN